MSPAIGHVECLFSRGEIADVRFDAHVDQPVPPFREDQLACLRLRQNFVYCSRVHTLSLAQVTAWAQATAWARFLKMKLQGCSIDTASPSDAEERISMKRHSLTRLA